MKSNNELERKDIVIDSDIEASEPNLITIYIESLFDVDKKFGTKTNDDDNRWVNFYAQYNVSDGSLKLSYHIDTPDGITEHEYTPIGDEKSMIIGAITEKIKNMYGQTPLEFCTDAFGEEVYVYENHDRCTEKQLAERWKTLRAYINEHGYDMCGSTTISLPMSNAGEHFRDMIDYCESRCITKILVSNNHDIADDENGLRRVLNRLCDKGFSVIAVDEGITYAPQDQAPPEEEIGEGITMGGI